MSVKISQLSSSISLIAEDLLVVVKDPSGTPLSRKITAQKIVDLVSNSTLESLVVTSLKATVISGTELRYTSISASAVTASAYTGSFRGNGSQVTGLTASNISNFTSDTRNQFSAGTGVSITSGQISANSVPNASLQNSTVTIGSTNVSLGDTITTIQGLSVVTGSIVTGSVALFTVLSASVVSASQYIGLGDVGARGANTTIQFNSGSALSGTTDLVYDYTNGYLGIGNSAPTCKLDMIGTPVIDGDNRVVLQVIDTTSMAADVGAGFTFGGKFTSAGAIAGWAGIKGIKENSSDGNLDAALVFMTRKNGAGSITEKMRITSGGKVGIGTSSPTVALQVQSGDIYIADTSTSAVRNFNITQGGGQQELSVGYRNSNAGIGGVLNNSQGTILTNFNAAGGLVVGTLGTTAPMVFVQGGDPGAATSVERLKITNTEVVINNPNESINFRVGASGQSNALFIQGSAGRVGVNKTSPNSTLDVNGNTILSGTLTVTGSTTLVTISGTSAQFTQLTASLKGNGSQITGITASNITNFTSDTRNQFSAGTNITIVDGQISSTGGSGTPGGADKQLQFNSGSVFSGSSNLTFDYATSILSGTSAQFTQLTASLKGNGSQVTNITAANITNFTVDVLGKFSAGSGISTNNGVISLINNSITIGSTSVTLGNTSSVVTGLANISSSFVTGGIGLFGNTVTIQTGTISASNIIVSTLTASGGALLMTGSLSGYTAAITSSATNYTLVAADSGKLLTINSGALNTVTVPSGLPLGFSVTVAQIGAGQVQVTASSPVVLNNRQGQFKTAGQFAVLTVIHTGSNGFIVAGDTAG